MKLIRFGDAGHERPGLMDESGVLRDLSGHLPDLTGPWLSPEALAHLATIDPAGLPPIAPGTRLGPPIGQIGKLIGIGLNYADHARESGAEAPTEPIVFMKATSCISGPNDAIRLPAGSTKTDWEVELGVVMGRRARAVAEADALEHVAGYTIVHDVSERHHQIERGGQWTKGKSFDSFGPIGPWLVTRDEVPDPHDLALWCDVNGVRRQDSSTRELIFGVPYLVSYLSRHVTLEPGDVIATGTPAGVGLGMTPPVYLTAGDTVRLGVEGLGIQEQRVVGG